MNEPTGNGQGAGVTQGRATLKRSGRRAGPGPAAGGGVEGERLPPHAPEAEAALLGSILAGTPEQAAEALNLCEERGVRTEWFYDLRHQVIAWAMFDAHRRGQAVNGVLLYQWLADSGRLADAGGAEYVMATLETRAVAPSAVESFLGVLEDKWRQRQLLRVAAQISRNIQAAEDKVDVGRVLNEAHAGLAAVEESGPAREQAVKPLLLAVTNELEQYHRGQAQIRGLTTGLRYLDKLLCGIGGKDNNFVVLAGRPGTGKTALALDIALHAALDYEWWEESQTAAPGEAGPALARKSKRRGVPVGIFSLEMTAEALVKRMLFSRARADMQRWRTGMAYAEDMPPLVRATEEIGRSQIWIDDQGRLTIDELKARARRWNRQFGIRLFVVDYVQLLTTASRRFRDDRVQELAEISGELQKLGKELETPVVVLAQMNRDYEKDPNRKPRLSDLKDCGAIEQDADVVGFLYEPKNADEEEDYVRAMDATYGQDWSRRPSRINLLLAKSRNGPTGDCKLLFQKSCGHFYDFGQWMEEHGFKERAKGEKATGTSRGELPSNEELGIE